MATSPFRRLCHWGPISVLGIIKLITWAMVHVLGMWWPPHETVGGALHAMLFLGLAASTLYYFLQSLLEGPGFVPSGWKPDKEEDTQFLQYCSVCNGYKAPRAHHCRKCGYCVKKMDHHCPWINCCVGHANHCYFTMFLTCAVLGCFHASVNLCTYVVCTYVWKYCVWVAKWLQVQCHLYRAGDNAHCLNSLWNLGGASCSTLTLISFIVLSICIYHAINRVWYIHKGSGQEPIIYLSLTTLLFTLLAIGMAVGVVLAVSALLFLQIRGIVRNQTAIEDWIMEKAISRREEQGIGILVYPYDLGWKRNLKMVLYGERSDGISWPLKEGCKPYDLTMEQKIQKQEKRLRSRMYTATGSYSGRWLPVMVYPRAAISAPCTDEMRLPLVPGDVIRVTRQRRHWLFGEKVDIMSGEETRRGPRGWFPRDSVTPAFLFSKPKPD